MASEAAFEGLAEPLPRELHVHCYRMLASFDEAEDAVQETFLRAWRARDSFDGSSLFRAWLYKIATNVCLDAIRRNGRGDTVLEAAVAPGMPAGVQGEIPGPNQAASRAASSMPE